ncbi:hypothetical protein CP965_10290 [Halarcobacter mediterraneus]|uniref:Lipid/polyisoprenoid-binding YceI-like domain-containing protein n=1 Tax=Halarcobacter mediterraneus TaxID=2023153 RepID=A0A4Q1B2K6_9BACT|nr:hypothetical protein [Halarcobacter mediterraneus]RXK12159.1 hypothetical protein CP965_10290 [Halarcobacter mediterraneus]
MKKTVFSLVTLGILSSNLFAGSCEDNLKYDFTFFGAPDKSYVVTKNTFTNSKSNFPNGKLLNATLEIDALSLDTSADMNNGKAMWPASMAKVRNMNTVNNFFKGFEKDIGKINVKIIKVAADSMDVEFKMNGETKVIPFSYKTEGDTIKASGKLDVLAFNTNKAWTRFAAVCSAFHKGKSWNEIDVFFEVPASCK